jgi:hypothetical protein
LLKSKFHKAEYVKRIHGTKYYWDFFAVTFGSDVTLPTLKYIEDGVPGEVLEAIKKFVCPSTSFKSIVCVKVKVGRKDVVIPLLATFPYSQDTDYEIYFQAYVPLVDAPLVSASDKARAKVLRVLKVLDGEDRQKRLKLM